MPTVLITGGTGLIGRALSKELETKGFGVIILSREKLSAENQNGQNLRYAQWDPGKEKIEAWALAEADFIIHLAGEGIAKKRWTLKRKKEIAESRTRAADFLIKSIKEIPNKVKVLVAASAIGWYKPALPAEGNYSRIETEPPDPGFLGRTVRAWEQHLHPLASLGIRLVIFRNGIVLSNTGGALPEFMRPLRYGIAAVLGSGRQILSWIHIEDLCRIYLSALGEHDMQGIYNAVAPNPVSNKSFTVELAKLIRGRFFITVHVPAFLLRIVLGEMSIEVLKSARVSSEKIKQRGFQFMYPGIKSALQNLTGKQPDESF